MRKRSLSVTFGALMVVALTACAPSPEDSEYTSICVDEGTLERVEYSACEEGGNGGSGIIFRNWYSSSNHPSPAVGDKANPALGSFTKPSGSISTVSRGGFGGRAASGTS